MAMARAARYRGANGCVKYRHDGHARPDTLPREPRERSQMHSDDRSIARSAEASAHPFGSSCGRTAATLLKRSGFVHGGGLSPCTNRPALTCECTAQRQQLPNPRTRWHENLKISHWGTAQLEMTSPIVCIFVCTQRSVQTTITVPLPISVRLQKVR